MVAVAIRVDASQYIGSGHVMRCLALAEELKKNVNNVMFVMRPQPGDLCDYIEKRGFQVKRLPQPQVKMIPKSDCDYKAWLQVSELQDANEFLLFASDAEVVIVDHYGIGASWERLIKLRMSCILISIDDLVRDHISDMLIDQTASRMANEYEQTAPGSHLLVGSNYALLKAQFADLYPIAINKKIDFENHKLLLTMGGIDQPNATVKVLKTLSKATAPIPTTVVLGKKSPHFESVVSFCAQNSDWVTHIPFTDDMAALMLEHTIAIGASGSTSWERACMGLPSIIIPIAENQQQICQNLVKENVAISLSLDEVPEMLNAKLDVLLKNFEVLRANSLSLCDGKGCARVVATINSLVRHGIVLKHATNEDIRQVYDWQCLSETRRYALNPKIPTWKEHRVWMKNKLKSSKDFFYIVCYDAQQVGVVRLDNVSSSSFVISIFIAPKYHGKGLAKRALAAIDILHPSIEISATVLKENIASQALFLAAGYKQVNEELFIRRKLER